MFLKILASNRVIAKRLQFMALYVKIMHAYVDLIVILMAHRVVSYMISI
jgi:hypothetical protein